MFSLWNFNIHGQVIKGTDPLPLDPTRLLVGALLESLDVL